MPVVTNTVLLPDGSGAQYATVVIRLVANATVGTEAPGYVGTSEILGTFVPAVSSEGVWSLTLTANSLITPSGTVYQISTQIPGRPVVVEYISVPNGAGPYTVSAILTSAPSSITPTELAAHLADTVDAHDASAVSFAATEAWLSSDMQAAVVEGTIKGGVRQVRVTDPTSAASWQAAFDVALTAGQRIRVTAAAGTYTVRNLRIYTNTHLDLAGVTLQYGGSNGTVGPLEAVPVVLYAEGSSGTHLTNISITGGTILGQQNGTDFTTISGATEQDGVQFNYCDDVLVEGVTIGRHVQDGLVFSFSSGVRVLRCYFYDINDGAVEIRSGGTVGLGGVVIAHNRMVRVSDGIPVKPDVEDVLVIGNTIQHFRNGILYPARGWRIIGNHFSPTTTPDGLDGATNGYGINVSRHPALAATTNTIEDIYIAGNRFAGYTGSNTWPVRVSNSNGQTVSRVEVVGNGVSNSYRGAETTGGALFEGNAFAVTTTGIKATGASTITDNTISTTAAAGIGLDITGTDVVMAGNTVTSTSTSQAAIKVTAADCVVTGNRVFAPSSSGQGVQVAAATCVVTGNRISGASGTGQGVLLSSNDCVVSGNTITGQNHGVRITGNNNVVDGNRIRDAAFNGVQVQSGATKNLVVGNMLLNNPTPLSDSGTSTTSANNVVA